MNSKAIKKIQAQFAYGHREILLDYFSLPRNSVVIGVLQHGAGTAEMLLPDSKTPRMGISKIPHLVWSKAVAKELRACGDRRAISIGSPWAYLLASQKTPYQIVAENKSSIIYFPTHHSLSVDRNVNNREFRLRLLSLKQQFPTERLIVCLYYSEFLIRELHVVAEEEGVELVCPGIGGWDKPWTPHPARVNFLRNLFSIFSEAESVIFESFTTGIFYAASLNKRILYQPSLGNHDLRTLSLEHRIQNEWMGSSIFNRNEFVVAGEYLDIIEYMLGLGDILSKEEFFEVTKIKSIDFLV